jgi:Leucine-rich repeat (LRR) protein
MKFFNLAHSLFFCLLFSLSSLSGQTTITGNVYDAVTGLPLSGFVMATNPVGGRATTDVNGAYTMFVSTTGDFHVIVNSQQGRCYREKWTWGRKIVDFHLTACNNNQSRDSIALRSLYDNLNGASWTSPWNITQPITTWGLTYSTRGGGPIEFVSLNNRNLNGIFPTAATGFSNLLDLFGFDFSNNKNLKGTLPSLTNMKQLDWVNMDSTGMSGDPLSSIKGLKNLEFINIRNSAGMSTSFPSTLTTDWRNVYKLQLDGINVSGTIPSTLFALPNIQTLGLGQNKLTGTVPALPSGNSSTIRYLVLNDNDLDSVPNLSVSTTLTALGVKGNKLTFDDIIPNISKFNAAATYENSSNVFVYAPQDSFFMDTTYRKVVGDPLSIDLKIDGALTSNTYTWKKNGVFFRTTTTNKLVFASLASSDAGRYSCTVTNSNAPLLTLVSRNMTVNVSTVCRNRDSLALVDVYNALGGSSWSNPWNLNQPITTWNGVRQFTAQGCVTDFMIAGGNANGILPNTITNLTDLLYLTISNDSIKGVIPNSINQLTKLKTLSLSGSFTGSIPTTIGSLPALEQLGLGSKKLTGIIPTELGNLTNLTYLVLTYLDGLVSPLPLSLGNLTKLTTFSISGKNISGTIPSSFANLASLQTFRIQGTSMNGDIPPLLYRLSTLRSIGLCLNKFTGAISRKFMDSTGIVAMDVWGNQFDSVSSFAGGRSNFNFAAPENKLTFDDILPNVSRMNSTGLGFYNFCNGNNTYDSQSQFYNDTTITGTTGNSLIIDLKIDGALTTNQYKWFKNGVPQTAYNSTSNKLTINSLQSTDAGVWTCQVTNTSAPLLTLRSKNITIQVTQSCRSRDSLALVDLYNSTGGANWTNKWILTQPMTTWFGITLSASGCVEKIELNNQNLVGTINTSLDNMVNLQSLYLNNNRLSGSIPNFTLPNLQFFVLSGNQLSGTMPNFNLPSLKMIDHDNNQLSGSIPNLNLPNLFYFNLNNNRLSGTIPNFNLPRLQHLILPNNQLNGTIPNFNLPILIALDLSINQLTGTLPNLSLPELTFLSVSQNQVSGVIPNLALPKLITLNLEDNQFVGTLPNLNLPKLETLLCYQNKIDSCPKLTSLPSLQRAVGVVFKGLAVRNNKLTFDDIIPNIGLTANASYDYAPQDSFFVDTAIIANAGTPLSINLKIDGALTTNSYKWFKNGVLQSAYTSSSNKLIISSLQTADAGVWMCQVTNPAAPLLTLYSRKITLQVSAAVNPCRSRDSLALVALYNATGGTRWTSRTSNGKLSPWNLNQPMTTWYGVNLNNNGCVDTVFLNQNNLVGTISTTIDSLSELIVLGLGMNSMSGTIPSSLGNLSKLKHLDLAVNQFSGTIPTALGNLRQMQKFYLAGNRLTGTIPLTLGNFTQVVDFMVHNNQLSGSIPIELGNLELVKNLFFYNNVLTGSIPTTFGNLRNVNLLYLHKNQLSGTIPTELGNLTSLTVLALEENALTGTVPQSLRNLVNLQGLGLRKNLLDSIPNLSNLPLTDSILLDKNKLTFDDIIPIVKPKTTYTPQDSFFIETTINGTIGTPLSIDLKIDGALTTNSYKWFKNGVLQSAYTSNSNKLKINSLQATDAGVWTCQVTNSAAPLLTLQSRKITIQLGCAPAATGTPVTKTVCAGQTYTSPSGRIFSIAGTYNDTIKNVNNCDSVVYTLNLTIAPAATSQTLTPSVCTSYTSPSGKIFTTSGAKLDTLKNTNGCDSIRYTINLTIAPPTNAGALKFDGSNTSVELGSWFNYQIFSIEMWLKPGATQVTYADIIDNKHSTNINWVCQRWSDPNTYNFGANQAAWSFTLTADKWQHLALIKDSTRISIYINGILIDTAYHPLSINYDGNQFLTLGKHGYGGRNWNGEMDEVRLWSRVLCQTEIQARMNCELSGAQNGLLAYYKFNQGIVGCDNTSETVLKDETGQHNGTLKGFSLKDTLSNYTLGKVTGTCSNNIPNGLSTFYRDADGDNFGDLTKKIQACYRPSGYVSDSTDCNDNNPLAFAVAQPPAVSNITYCQNAVASPLSATGTNLRWYITASGGVGDSIAPTPPTSVLGTKSYFVTQSNGCESARAEIKVTIDASPNAINRVINPVSCTQYTSPSGRIINTSGTYRDTVKTVGGCDSIRYTINLTVQNTVTTQTLTPSVCTTFKAPSGKILNTTGVYQDTAKTINGCDSVRSTINLTVQNAATRQTTNPVICANQTYRSPSGKTFSTSGTKLDTLKTQSGCDSVILIINLNILTPQYQQAAPQSICKNDMYRGKILTRDTAFIDTLRSVGLCDSVITSTPVKVNNASVNNLNLSLCVGGSVTVNGIIYNGSNRSGQQILSAASAAGCDSIINISTTLVGNVSAVDDDYIIKDSINTLTFNVLANDFYTGAVRVTPINKPFVGRLDTLGLGRFQYSVPPQANGLASFSYRLCSSACPNVCDTGLVKVNIMRPRLNTDVSIGITPNCSCPNDKLLFPELELNPDKFPGNELVVISRWGDVVYRAKPYKNDWSGANEKGEYLPAGTYYYIMRLDLSNGKIKTGDVTIYR